MYSFPTLWGMYTGQARDAAHEDRSEVRHPKIDRLELPFDVEWFRSKMGTYVTLTAHQASAAVLWIGSCLGRSMDEMLGDIDRAVDCLWTTLLRPANTVDLGLALWGISPAGDRGPINRSDFRATAEFWMSIVGSSCVEEIMACLLPPVLDAAAIVRSGDSGVEFYSGWILNLLIRRDADLREWLCHGEVREDEVKANYNGTHRFTPGCSSRTHFKHFRDPGPDGELSTRYIVVLTEGLGYYNDGDPVVPDEFMMTAMLVSRPWVFDNGELVEGGWRTWKSFSVNNALMRNPAESNASRGGTSVLYEHEFAADDVLPLIDRFLDRFKSRMSSADLYDLCLGTAEPLAEFLRVPLSSDRVSRWTQKFSSEGHGKLEYPRLYGVTTMLTDDERGPFFDLAEASLPGIEDLPDEILGRSD